MSTKRKTLKQKRISDLRKTQITSETEITQSAPVYSIPTVTKRTAPPSAQPTQKYFSYDLSDVRQSLTVSSLLVLTNAIIYILVENGVIPLRIIGL